MTQRLHTVAADTDLFLADPSEGLVSLATYRKHARRTRPRDRRQRFRFGNARRPRLHVSREDGRLQRLTERTGNWVEIRATASFHSTGPAVTWTRNAAGRLTEVRDLRGGKVEYSLRRRRSAHRRQGPRGQPHEYDYEPIRRRHQCRQAQAHPRPSGTPVLGNEYEPNGRLFLQQSAANNALVRMVHSLTTRTEQKIRSARQDHHADLRRSRPGHRVARSVWKCDALCIRRGRPTNRRGKPARAHPAVRLRAGPAHYTFPGEGPAGPTASSTRASRSSRKSRTPKAPSSATPTTSKAGPRNSPMPLEERHVRLRRNGKRDWRHRPLGNVTTFAYNAAGRSPRGLTPRDTPPPTVHNVQVG